MKEGEREAKPQHELQAFNICVLPPPGRIAPTKEKAMIHMHPIFMLVLLILLLGLSAFFSRSETALMAISRLRLRYQWSRAS